MNNKKTISLFILIFALAAYFRFVGINWDQNQHLHPDERFLTMVTGSMSWPKNLAGYFDTAKSSLNPHNLGYDFFVYGTYPAIFVKLIAGIFHQGDYNGITIFGRYVSALLDMGTLLLVYLIAWMTGRYFAKDDSVRNNVALLAVLFYAVMWVPIQQAHFFAVDTYLTFFLTFSLYLVLKIINPVSVKNNVRKIFYFSLLGLVYGLAISAKISALLFLPVIGIGLIVLLVRQTKFTQVLAFGLLFSLFTFISVKLFYPYLFTSASLFSELNSKILNNWQSLKAFDGINTTFPPALQWIPTKPIIFAAVNNFFWGLGIPVSLLTIFSCGYLIILMFTKVKEKVLFTPLLYSIFILIFWIILTFGYQGLQFAQALRYFYPVYPALAVILGLTVWRLIETLILHYKKPVIKIFSCLLFVIMPIWFAFAFTTIYRLPHTRVSASAWIYQHLPPGSIITMEVWDDGIPLPINYNNSTVFQTISLALYDPDSADKWLKLSRDLSRVDYIMLTSNRLWRSLSALPDRYPLTANYYAKLFDNRLGFTEIATFTSYPCLLPNIRENSNLRVTKTDLRPPVFSLDSTPNCFLALNDDGAEESFTVYDHPKVLIFQNTGKFTPEQIYNLIYER